MTRAATRLIPAIYSGSFVHILEIAVVRHDTKIEAADNDVASM
jgi:hypothetical protein